MGSEEEMRWTNPVSPYVMKSPQQRYGCCEQCVSFGTSSLYPKGHHWNGQNKGWGREIKWAKRRRTEGHFRRAGVKVSWGDKKVRMWAETLEGSRWTFLSQLWVGGGILTECLTNKIRHRLFQSSKTPPTHDCTARGQKDFGRKNRES